MKRFDVAQVLSGAAYALAITFGALMCPVTAFHMPIDPYSFFLTCAGLSALAAVLCGLRRTGLWLCGAAVIIGVLIYLNWNAFTEAFFVAANAVVTLYCEAFSLGQELLLPEGMELSGNANAFLALLAALAAFLCAFSLEKRHTPVLCAAAGLPFLILCLIILETVPAAWAVLLLVGALALAFLTQSIRRENAEAACRLSALLMLPLAATIALLVLLSPPDTYERGQWSDRLQSGVSTALDKLSMFRLNESTGQMEFVSPFSPSTLGSRVWDSSVERVDLSRVGPQSKTGRHVMDVYSPATGSYHLRADSMAVYQDNTWTALPRSAYDGLSVPDGAFLSETDDAARILQIRTDMKSSICYLPYKPTALPDDMSAYLDAYVRNPQQLTQYSIEYSTRYRWSETEGDSDYTAFVRQYYLQLPDSLRESLSALDAVQALPQASVSGVESCTAAVTALVQRGKTYSLATERVPSGEDFVYWFLTQSDTGYCVHFATSAALLLRWCGVPARYATGYSVSAAEGEWTPVTEDAAHAWVEYYDGTQWLVLDPTPADLSEETPETSPEPDTAEPEPTPDVQTPSEPDVSQQPETPSTAVSTSNTGGRDTPQTTTAAGSAAGKSGAWLTPLLWALGLLALIGLWFGYRVLRLAARTAQLTSGNVNRRTVMYFRHLRFLSKLAGSEIPPELEALALKAKYSQHRLTLHELAPMQAHCDALTHQLMQERRFWKRLLYRMIYVIY